MKRHRRSRFRFAACLAVIAAAAVCVSARAGQVSAPGTGNTEAVSLRPAASDRTIALHRRIARLRRTVSATTASQGEPFARTAEEAKQKITEQLIAEEMKQSSAATGWDAISLSGCSFLLSDAEQVQIQEASRKFISVSRRAGPEDPPVELRVSGPSPQISTDLQGAHQAAEEILGRERYVEIFRSCNAIRLESNSKDRIMGVKVIATALDLPPEMTATIQKLAEEKDRAFEDHAFNNPTHLDEAGSLIGSGTWPQEGTDAWSQEEIDEWSRVYEKISDRYDRQFRDLLGPELWTKYKQSFTDYEWQGPWQKVRLAESGGALFQKPLDEAEPSAEPAAEPTR
jgi:hypothetical protein